MNRIIKVDVDAFNWLRKIKPKYWLVDAFDKLVKCDHTTNNMTESWNVSLGDVKKAPIITLMEYIKKKLMQTIIKRKTKHQRWRTKVLFYINKKMNKLIKVRR